MSIEFKFKPERVEELFNACASKRIAVVGDLMVDRYFWGEIERISPEAPVPVVEVAEESHNFGGAANVANNLSALGAHPIPFGVIGSDLSGEMFKEKMREKSIETAYIFTDPDRPTTVKTRIIAHSQHVVRVDRESRDDIPPGIEDELIGGFREMAGSFDAVIFQDYNKGVITNRIIKEIIKTARKSELLIAVDPKFHNFFQYHDVTLFKPNIKETEAALGTKIRTEDDLMECGNRIFDRINPQHLLITRGAKGVTLFEERGKNPSYLPTITRKVHDVSGAGDTVIAALTTFCVSGGSLVESAVIANFAAGSVCEEVGVVPVDKEKLKQILLSNPPE